MWIALSISTHFPILLPLTINSRILFFDCLSSTIRKTDRFLTVLSTLIFIGLMVWYRILSFKREIRTSAAFMALNFPSTNRIGSSSNSILAEVWRSELLRDVMSCGSCRSEFLVFFVLFLINRIGLSLSAFLDLFTCGHADLCKQGSASIRAGKQPACEIGPDYEKYSVLSGPLRSSAS